jgi:hypothetical protein
MGILSHEDLEFFATQGYVRVSQAVPRETCEAAADVLWDFLGMDKEDPASWYRFAPGSTEHWSSSFMLRTDLHLQHPALWETRQSPAIHQAFADIWKTEKLFVSIDKANLKPPVHPDHPEFDYPGFLHWDVPAIPWPPEFGVQGVLYLADTVVNQGGFHCLPGLNHSPDSLDACVDLDKSSVPIIDIDRYETVPVPGECGDFIIWDRRLPHGNGRNTADRPRLSQYITMWPATVDEQSRAARIAQFEQGMEKPMTGTTGTFELTALGRKLVGMDAWA